MKKVLGLLLVFVIVSCKQKETSKVDSNSSEKTEVKSDSDQLASSVKLEKIWETADLKTAESVLFDELRGVYYVSCIQGVPPTSEDGDGHIATLDQKGNVINKYFAINMDAPKGMAVDKDYLYVTDINEFVVIELATGTMGKNAIYGAEFLNDVALGEDGSVYFTDMNTNTVYRYNKGEITRFLQDEQLANPNGISIDGNSMYVVSFAKGDFFKINMTDKSITTLTSGEFGAGDGIVPWKGGFMVSDWNGTVKYRDASGKSVTILDTQEAKLNAADIGINSKAGELVVPTFFGNSVAAYRIVD